MDMLKKFLGFGKEKTQEPTAKASAIPDDELIAVISAAVYAFYEGTGITPRVRSVRPATGTRPVWAAAGLLESTRPFLP